MSWEVGEVIWQRRSGAAWSTEDVSIPAMTEHDFRGGFTVVNGSGPIPTGDLTFQVHRGELGWEDLFEAKDIEPGHPVGGSEPVVPPTFVEWPLLHAVGVALINTRLKLVSAMGTFFSAEQILVTILPGAAAVEPELLDEFADDVTVGAAVVKGIFEDPHARVLEITGRTPMLTCDSGAIAGIRLGNALTVRGTGYIVRSIQPGGSGLTRLFLEAA